MSAAFLEAVLARRRGDRTVVRGWRHPSSRTRCVPGKAFNYNPNDLKRPKCAAPAGSQREKRILRRVAQIFATDSIPGKARGNRVVLTR